MNIKLSDLSLRYVLDQLQTFVAVAEAGSFSAARHALNRVQSAISCMVGKFELAIDALGQLGSSNQVNEHQRRLPLFSFVGRG